MPHFIVKSTMRNLLIVKALNIRNLQELLNQQIVVKIIVNIK